jgi:hypothetical protein
VPSLTFGAVSFAPQPKWNERRCVAVNTDMVPKREPRRGQVTNRGTTRLVVRFVGEDHTVSIRSHLVWMIPR